MKKILLLVSILLVFSFTFVSADEEIAVEEEQIKVGKTNAADAIFMIVALFGCAMLVGIIQAIGIEREGRIHEKEEKP